MSSSIWTRCAGESELRTLRLSPWRAVEAQHQISTRKLVDSIDEQLLLEDLIDTAKPPGRAPRLHYLLSTPFRYPRLRHGSRFGSRRERGIWYGSESLRSMFAEVAYYRLLFLEGTSANLGLLTSQLSIFAVRAGGRKGIDLLTPPFDVFHRAIASKSNYDTTQILGAAMRAAGVQLFRYPSARDAGGVNVGVIDPSAFGSAKPRDFQTWHCLATRDAVELTRSDFVTRESFLYSRELFLVRGKLPSPAL